MTSDQDTKKPSCPAPTSRERSKRKPRGYWNDKERCREDAKGYDTKNAWRKVSSGAYTVALKNGWLDEVCAHMSRGCKPAGYWTKERCHEEALKYQFKVDFSKGCTSAYSIAHRNGWLDEICGHMVIHCKPVGYWTKKNCHNKKISADRTIAISKRACSIVFS